MGFTITLENEYLDITDEMMAVKYRLSFNTVQVSCSLIYIGIAKRSMEKYVLRPKF